MPNFVSDRRLWLTQDRKSVVEEGDDNAAFLLVGEGGVVSEEDAQKYNLRLREEEQPSALEQEKQALDAARERGAMEEVRMRRVRVADLEDEEDQAAAPKAARASGTKAQSAPSENKSARSGAGSGNDVVTT